MQIARGPAHTMWAWSSGGGPSEAGAPTHEHWGAPLPSAAGALVCRPAMASAVSPAGVVGLLLVSALPGVLGDRSSPDLRAHPGTSEGCWGEAGIALESQPY